jgi:uncharacterized membrane protein YkvA (DUF1232 family)
MSTKKTIPTFLKENWLLALAVLYVFSPIDLIPDILPAIGGLDDSLLVLIELIRQYGKYKKGTSGEA